MIAMHELSVPTANFLCDGDFIKTLTTDLAPQILEAARVRTPEKKRRSRSTKAKPPKTEVLLQQLVTPNILYTATELSALVGRSSPAVHEALRSFFLPQFLVVKIKAKPLGYVWRFK